jgi:hypothetical protein
VFGFISDQLEYLTPLVVGAILSQKSKITPNFEDFRGAKRIIDGLAA